MVNGIWQTDGQIAASDGRFHRAETSFRSWITPDGAPGPSGEGGFPAEGGRYHLYVAWACPWAHRTLILRTLKRLETLIGVSFVEDVLGDEGWLFSERRPDDLGGRHHLYEVYAEARADYTGRASVPVLWDKQRGTIVSNESSEIIRMFNSAFDRVGADTSRDYYPKALRGEIDRLNDVIYATVNDGVYRCGFARTQEAYDEAATALFETLDMIEEVLSANRYLTGDRLTEADWRLFPTLFRFDAIYVTHFKCNLRRISDYTNISGYLRELYQVPGIAATTNLEDARRHYFLSHRSINPRGIIPIGPEIDLTSAHGRERLRAA